MLSLLSLRKQIDAGSLTPREAIALSTAAIAEHEPEIQALVSRNPVPFVAEQGPLAGIAVGVKDILDTADLPTQMGSPIYEGWRPRADAAAVARLRRLGAVPLAKTTTTAFAFLDPTQTRNPRHPGHTPGGSSAGSAAAVSAGMLPLALGTQTGGSVIRPAAYCGVVGMKPSFGLLPTVGMKCFSWTLDTLGLFTAGVADAALALAQMTGRPGIDLPTTNPGTPRIGVVLQDFCADAEPEALDALERVRAAAEAIGSRVCDVVLPAVFAEAFGFHGTIQDFEAAQALNWEYATHRANLGPLLRAHLDDAQNVSPNSYDASLKVAGRARRQLPDQFAEHDLDVILTLSAPGPAPEGYASTGDSRFNRLWTLMGVPCVTVPVGSTPTGLPLGVQVIARHGDDARALKAAHCVETLMREQNH
ncbi:amidase [Methylobacterium bullatum]|uniref:Amidase AmiD n=1 Tax=Methylobacterium bullatum TaxID=570505 RepID=A0AAV4YZV1_9HYPH|nr:amidase [Methylobacterium bullatum]MBD8901284.1 amidase [Methylobacterium bullatum]GJD37581.1 Putative amidase AmiD [Methylobacterium bullatum]